MDQSGAWMYGCFRDGYCNFGRFGFRVSGLRAERV